MRKEFPGTEINGSISAIQKVRLPIESGSADGDPGVGPGEIHQCAEGPFTFRFLDEFEERLAFVLISLQRQFGVHRLDRGLGKLMRSEERRVGKERRSRWSPYH